MDLGSTYIKAVGVVEEGRTTSVARRPTPWVRQSGVVFLDPVELVEGCRALTWEVTAQTKQPEVVEGIGITSMGETGVLVDKENRPLAPAIAWFDASAVAEVARLQSELGDERFAARTGVKLDHTRSVVKYAWLRNHVPATSRGVRWLNLAEWVAAGLGGAAVSERTLLARTGFVDLDTARPWDDALAAVHAPKDLVQPVAHGFAVARPGQRGRDRSPGGLDHAGIVVSGHDHAVEAHGLASSDTFTPGSVVVSCGTSITVIGTAETLPDKATRTALVESGLSVGPAVTGEGYIIQGGFLGGKGLSECRLGIERRLGQSTFASVDAAAAALIERSVPPEEKVANAISQQHDRDEGPGLESLVMVKRWEEAVLAVWQEVGRIEKVLDPLRKPGERIVCGRWIESEAFRQAARATTRAPRRLKFLAVADEGCVGAAYFARLAMREG